MTVHARRLVAQARARNSQARRSVPAGLAFFSDLAGRSAWPGNPPGRHLSMSSWEVKMVRHPLVGYLVWAVLFAALFAWEGLSLARVGSLPTLSDVFRVIMRYPVGRWALFALWLWAGWHFFVRGWHFLLRA